MALLAMSAGVFFCLSCIYYLARRSLHCSSFCESNQSAAMQPLWFKMPPRGYLLHLQCIAVCSEAWSCTHGHIPITANGRVELDGAVLTCLSCLSRYTGCPVTYQSGQTTGQAVTNNAGGFSIPVPGATSFGNGLVSLAANSPGCIDALTKLPPPFSMGALVPPAKGVHNPTLK